MQRAVPTAAQTERLGKYEIVRHIATGGMAEIHLARATGIEGFEKMVVLKRILPQFSTNQEFVQMFLDEARIAATLHHPNIVQVYDIGSVRGQYFFAMEFLQGEDVRRVMESVIRRRSRNADRARREHHSRRVQRPALRARQSRHQRRTAQPRASRRVAAKTFLSRTTAA